MSSDLHQAIALFNAGDYFECHEALEAEWLRAAEPRRSFLKGLLHAAVALHHFRRGNAHGARVKAASAARYLSSYAPCYEGIEVGGLLAELTVFVAPLKDLPSGAPAPPPSGPWPVIHAASPGCRPQTDVL